MGVNIGSVVVVLVVTTDLTVTLGAFAGDSSTSGGPQLTRPSDTIATRPARVRRPFNAPITPHPLALASYAYCPRRRPSIWLRVAKRAVVDPPRPATGRFRSSAAGVGRRVPGYSREMPSAIWTGSISFGLVQVPVRLVGATKSRDVSFNQLEEGTARASVTRRCPTPPAKRYRPSGSSAATRSRRVAT